MVDRSSLGDGKGSASNAWRLRTDLKRSWCVVLRRAVFASRLVAECLIVAVDVDRYKIMKRD